MVNMPALNTPQFDWVRAGCRARRQPVPPIFQPEVAARAILHAAEHPRRELQVGRSTYMALWGQKLAPGLLDWYLGKTGYASQQTTEPEAPDRPDNLEAPVDAAVDYGAHGRFDAARGRATEAQRRSDRRSIASRVHGRRAGWVSGGVRGCEDRSETRRVVALQDPPRGRFIGRA